ncbi:hypothetical protein [Vibrio breoganii]|nr:hypothetical protein [Vibrio breoganii]
MKLYSDEQQNPISRHAGERQYLRPYLFSSASPKIPAQGWNDANVI